DGAVRRARGPRDREERVRIRWAERARRRRRRCKTVRHYGPVTARAESRRQRARRARRARLELTERPPGLLHVPCDLRAEVRRARERQLVAQPRDERGLYRLAVEVAREVEQVRLEDAFSAAEGRPHAERSRSGEAPLAHLDPP